MIWALCYLSALREYSLLGEPIVMFFEAYSRISKRTLIYHTALQVGYHFYTLADTVNDTLTRDEFLEVVTRYDYCTRANIPPQKYYLFYFAEDQYTIAVVLCPEPVPRKYTFRLIYGDVPSFCSVNVARAVATDKYGLLRYLKDVSFKTTSAIITLRAYLRIYIKDVNDKIIMPKDAIVVFNDIEIPVSEAQSFVYVYFNVMRYKGELDLYLDGQVYHYAIEVPNMMLAFYMPVCIILVVYFIALLLPQISKHLPRKIMRLINIIYGNQVQKQIFRIQQRILDRYRVEQMYRIVFTAEQACDFEYSDDASELQDVGAAADLFPKNLPNASRVY